MSDKAIPEGYYIYMFRDLEGTPRYVGKGIGNRHADRSPYGRTNAVYLLLRSKKHMPVDIIASGLNEEEAYKLEAETISKFGRLLDGGTLFNVSPGLRKLGGVAIATRAREMAFAEVTRLIGEEWLRQHNYILPLTHLLPRLS